MSYAPPPYPPGPPQGFPPPPRRSRGPLIAVIVVVSAFVLLTGVGTAVLLLSARGDDPTRASGALKAPIRFQQVTAETQGACSGVGTPSADRKTCYRLAADGMTVTRVKRIEVESPDPAHGRTSWMLGLDFEPADAQAFAGLSAKAAAAGSQQPGKIAMVVGGDVVSAPQVMEAITGGRVEISGNFDERAARELFRRLTGSTG